MQVILEEIRLDDVWDENEPIVLDYWINPRTGTAEQRTLTLPWLRTNELDLVQHIEMVLNKTELPEDDFEKLLYQNGDDVGQFTDSLWHHAENRTLTDVGSTELAMWACGLSWWHYFCGWHDEEESGIVNEPGNWSTSEEPFDREDAWPSFVSEEPRLEQIERRLATYSVSPQWHLHGSVRD